MLTDKIALVTGASRGIGRAVALQLAEQGAQVIGTATSEKGAENITAYLKEAGLNGHGIVLNVADPDNVKATLAELQNEVGAPQIVVNNAGITRDNLFMRMKDEEWDDVIGTNLSGIFHVCRTCIKPMIKARWGRIVNIGSVVGTSGNPGQANYVASKAGVIGFSKSLAIELASRNVTVNVVAPGFIDTDMTKALNEKQRESILNNVPMNRLGQPDDIAAAVTFLVSPGADYMTGQTLHVNGGMYLA